MRFSDSCARWAVIPIPTCAIAECACPSDRLARADRLASGGDLRPTRSKRRHCHAGPRQSSTLDCGSSTGTPRRRMRFDPARSRRRRTALEAGNSREISPAGKAARSPKGNSRTGRSRAWHVQHNRRRVRSACSRRRPKPRGQSGAWRSGGRHRDRNPAPCASTSTCDEGTAMLEIVHDLAPGAQLYSPAAQSHAFAQKIRDLQPPAATSSSTTSGTSSRRRFRTVRHGVVSNTKPRRHQAGRCWPWACCFLVRRQLGHLNEPRPARGGDFLDGGAAAAPIPSPAAAQLQHDCCAAELKTVTVASTNPYSHWSDPLGASGTTTTVPVNSTGTSVLAAPRSPAARRIRSSRPRFARGNALSREEQRGRRAFSHLSTNRGFLGLRRRERNTAMRRPAPPPLASRPWARSDRPPPVYFGHNAVETSAGWSRRISSPTPARPLHRATSPRQAVRC